jgi:hypothetical protein
MVLSWLGLEAAVLVPLHATGSATLADDLTRATIRLALAYYAAAATLMLLLPSPAWRALTGRGRLARWCWTLAWASYLVHLFVAFHYYHHWSHADAVAHTRQVSGWGEGIYVSHLFTLVWTLDVAGWWLWPERYAGRTPWIDRALHGFMVFIIFNATVVYERGPIRWAGLLLFMGLAAVALWRHWRTIPR